MIQSSRNQDLEQLSCDKVEALLPLVAEGVLGPADDPTLFQHLAACPDCQRSLATHDLIDLALACGPRRSHLPDESLHWRRIGWTAAAAGLLATLGLGGLLTRDDDTLAQIPAQPEIEVVHIEHDEDGGAFLHILRDGRLIIVPVADAIYRENRESEPAPGGAVPVASSQRRLRR